MTRARKALLLAAKSLLAAALLAWVLSGVHWRDYVVERGTGRSLPIVARQDGACRVLEGPFWSRVESDARCDRFEPPVSGAPLTRPGVASSLRELRWGFLAAAVATHLLFLGILAVRWWLLLRAADVAMPLQEATALHFLGLFFNTFMPGQVGGDLIKGLYAIRRAHAQGPAVVSIVLDRLIGLLGLALFAAAASLTAALFGALDASQARRALLSSAAVTGGIAGALALLFSARLRATVGLRALVARLPLKRFSESVAAAADLYRDRAGALVWPATITLAATGAMVFSFAFLGMAVPLQTPGYSYLVYVPLVVIISAVPLTPGGVGVVEQLYVFYFASPLCSPSQILVFVLLTRMLGLFCSLPGAAVLLLGRWEVPRQLSQPWSATAPD